MKYDADHSLVVIDLVELEHCGFDHGNFDFELRSCGIDDTEARWPVALLVNFRGGHAVTPKTTDQTRAARTAARSLFKELVATLLNDKGPAE